MTQTVLLGDITTFLARGSAPKYTNNQGFYVLNQKCIRDWRVSLEQARFTDVTTKKVNEDRILKINDILVNSTGQGTLGRVGQFYGAARPATVDSHVTIVRAKTDLVDPVFLGYVLKGREKEIESLAEGSTGQTELSRFKLADLKIAVPSLDEQKKIANILGTIDEKIELNRKMNETLEQMGQALFRHYFIDNPEAEGWQEVKVSDLLEFIGGSQPPKSEHIYEKKAGYIRFVQNRDYSSNNHHTYIPVAKRNKVCNETDIMMDKYGEAGRVRFGIPGAYNVALAKIVPKLPNTQEYLRSYFSIPQIQKSLEGAAAASTRSSLNATTFAGLKISMPTSKLLVQFEDEQKTRLRMIMRNDQQIQTLIALRNTLLPRLINGKVKLD